MLRLISPADMQASEKHYFETSGVPSIDIMERAAQALADTALARFPDAKTIYIACGPGGNGGDGYACARMLVQAGKACKIYASAPAKSADAVENARRAKEAGIEIIIGELPQDAPDLWIDCIYGTGLSRAPEGFALDLLSRICANQVRQHSRLIACDIPSGLNGQTGEAYPLCPYADITVTFQLGKHGLYLQHGLDRCGEIIVADVGFPEEIFPQDLIRLIETSDIHQHIPRRYRNIHKGSCGHLLIIAGSAGMAGAAALCAKAALRSSVGLVTIACPQSIVPILQIHAPCAMCIPLPEKNGAICADALPILLEAFPGKNAVAIGPGLSRKVPPEIIRAVLESELPAVIDADALNILSENPDLKGSLKYHHVITPHPGEAARLLVRPCSDPVADAQALSALGATAVLKGASRVICGKKSILISTSGSNGMARGGSGDVLTGLMGGLLAIKEANRHRAGIDLSLLPSSIANAAACACEIHGLAGELAQEKYGRSMNAADIIEFLPEVFKRYVD